MKTIFKIVGYVFLGFIAMAILGSLFGEEEEMN